MAKTVRKKRKINKKTLRKRNTKRKNTRRRNTKKKRSNQNYVIDLSKSTMYGGNEGWRVLQPLITNSQIDFNKKIKKNNVVVAKEGEEISEKIKEFIEESSKEILGTDIIYIGYVANRKILKLFENYDEEHVKKKLLENKVGYHIIPSQTGFPDNRKYITLLNYDYGTINKTLFNQYFTQLLEWNKKRILKEIDDIIKIYVGTPTFHAMKSDHDLKKRNIIKLYNRLKQPVNLEGILNYLKENYKKILDAYKKYDELTKNKTIQKENFNTEKENKCGIDNLKEDLVYRIYEKVISKSIEKDTILRFIKRILKKDFILDDTELYQICNYIGGIGNDYYNESVNTLNILPIYEEEKNELIELFDEEFFNKNDEDEDKINIDILSNAVRKVLCLKEMLDKYPNLINTGKEETKIFNGNVKNILLEISRKGRDIIEQQREEQRQLEQAEAEAEAEAQARVEAEARVMQPQKGPVMQEQLKPQVMQEQLGEEQGPVMKPQVMQEQLGEEQGPVMKPQVMQGQLGEEQGPVMKPQVMQGQLGEEQGPVMKPQVMQEQKGNQIMQKKDKVISELQKQKNNSLFKQPSKSLKDNKNNMGLTISKKHLHKKDRGNRRERRGF